MVSAAGAVRLLSVMIARAEAAGDLANARRLKCESMKQRAAYEHAVYRVVEVVCEEPDGDDLVDALLGIGDRLLANVLLDE